MLEGIFAADVLHPIRPEVSVKHFQEVKDGRDRFGNRIFASSELGYTDKQGDEVRAGMLVPPQGQRFLRQNPRILKDITAGLSKLETLSADEKKLSASSEVQLGEGRKLRYLASGRQS